MNSVPSLLVNEYRRFTPEMRDKVIDKLRQSARATNDPTYRMLTLRQLAEFESMEPPVISLYLQLTLDRRRCGAWHIAFKDLVAATLGGSPTGADARDWSASYSASRRPCKPSCLRSVAA